MPDIKEGDKVEWDWGNGKGLGKVQSVFTESTTRKIKGAEVTRNGSKDDPALNIKLEEGDEALKLASEVSNI